MIKKCCETCRYWGDSCNNNVCCIIMEHRTTHASLKAGLCVDNDCNCNTRGNILLVTVPTFCCSEWKKVLQSTIRDRKNIETYSGFKLVSYIAQPR